MTGYVRGQLTGTGNGTPIDGATDIDLIVSGTFTATLKLEVATADATGADTYVQLGADITAPTVVNVKMADKHKWRVRCSAFTSGVAVFELFGSINLQLHAAP